MVNCMFSVEPYVLQWMTSAGDIGHWKQLDGQYFKNSACAVLQTKL